jgi:hypothetical protein
MGNKQHHLAIAIPKVIAAPPSDLNAVPIVDSINGNQPDGITIQIGHPTGSGINPKFYVARSIQ